MAEETPIPDDERPAVEIDTVAAGTKPSPTTSGRFPTAAPTHHRAPPHYPMTSAPSPTTTSRKAGDVRSSPGAEPRIPVSGTVGG